MAVRLIDEVSEGGATRIGCSVLIAGTVLVAGLSLCWWSAEPLWVRITGFGLALLVAMIAAAVAGTTVWRNLDPIDSAALKPLDAYGSRKTVLRAIQSELDTDVLYESGHRFTKNWVLFFGDPPNISHVTDVMWVYEVIPTANGSGPAGTTHDRRLHIWVRSGKRYIYPCDADSAQRVVDALVQRNPDLYVGHDADIAAAVTHNAVTQLAKLPALVQQRRQAQAGDIQVDLHLTAEQAANGVLKQVEALGEVHKVQVPAGVATGMMLRLIGKGVERPDGTGRGSLFLVICVDESSSQTPRD